MGITIHYDLRLPHIKSAPQARAFLTKLQKFARTQPFSDVSKILPWKRGNEPMIGMMHEFPIYDEDQGPDAPLCFAKEFFLAIATIAK